MHSEANTLLKRVTYAVMARASGNGKSWFRRPFSLFDLIVEQFSLVKVRYVIFMTH